MPIEQLLRPQDAEWQLGQRSNCPQHPHAIQAANVDELERKSSRRHELRLKAFAGADEDRLVAVGFELPRHREQRHHMPTRSSAGHHDGCHTFSILSIRSAR